MRLHTVSLIVLALAMPAAAYAQGAAAGATAGAIGGAVVGGPVGAVVGAAGGAIVGGIADENRPRFHEYVIGRHVPSYTYSGQIVVGATLPETVTVYDVPMEYGVTTYRYAYVNNTPVLVDPHTHRIVQIIG
jgi:hypothetical protein